jgi:hypothetical protein
MALTRALPAARNVVLPGDRQQFEQPTKDAHPDGADVTVVEDLPSKHSYRLTIFSLIFCKYNRMYESLIDRPTAWPRPSARKVRAIVFVG